MNRFSNILYVNDPTNNRLAMERAINLARSNGAKLTIANVSASEDFPVPLGNLEKTFLRLQDQQLEKLLAKIPSDGVVISIKHLKGIPFIQIVREVIQQGVDIVIKPVEGEGGFADMLFGSDDLHLLRKCPCPVWLIKPTKRKAYKRILAAVDPDPNVKANTELNKLILDLAASLAQQEKCKLHIVHAWQMKHEKKLRSSRINISKSDVDKMVREARKLYKTRFDDLLSQFDFQGIRTKVHYLKGDPGDVIPDQAKKKGVDLIIMGTVARTGIPGFFIGNTAEKTLRRVDCSVLTVKPSAFATPVE